MLVWFWWSNQLKTPLTHLPAAGNYSEHYHHFNPAPTAKTDVPLKVKDLMLKEINANKAHKNAPIITIICPLLPYCCAVRLKTRLPQKNWEVCKIWLAGRLLKEGDLWVWGLITHQITGQMDGWVTQTAAEDQERSDRCVYLQNYSLETDISKATVWVFHGQFDSETLKSCCQFLV